MTFHELSFCLGSHSLTLEQLTILSLNLAKYACTLCIMKRNCYKAFENFGVTTWTAARVLNKMNCHQSVEFLKLFESLHTSHVK